jgi:DNA-binding CsgD family transcriptional regulator
MAVDEDPALALYQALRAHGRFASDEELRKAAGIDADQARRGRQRLRQLGLVEVKEGALEPVEPDTALVRTLEAQHANAAELARRAAESREVSQALLAVYRPVTTREASQVEVEYLTDRRLKDNALVSLIATTRHSTDSMHPGPLPDRPMLVESLRQDASMVDRGVRVRAIYPLAVLQSPKYARYLHDLAGLGAEVRLIDHAPCDLLIFDRLLACLPGDPENRGGPMLLIRGLALAKSYVAFYEDFWLRSVPYEQTKAQAGTADGELTPQERVVIKLMVSGLSDDQIARRMGVHRRTVQRAVAKLMDRLHASSRFEAGLKLAHDPELARVLRRPSPPSPATRGAAS